MAIKDTQHYLNPLKAIYLMKKKSFYSVILFITGCASIPIDQQQLLHSGYQNNYTNPAQIDAGQAAIMQRFACMKSGVTYPSVSDLYNVDFSKITTIESFCDNHRNNHPEQAHCFDRCEINLSNDFERIKVKSEQMEMAKAEEYARQQEAKEQEAILTKEKLELEKKLRAGTAKPQNLEQAKIAHGSEDGESIVKSPRINPDNKLYHLIGTIEKASGDSPEFIGKIYINYAYAALSPSMLSINPYFYVNVPEELKEGYANNARINGGVSLIGRYVSNTEYSTIARETKIAPVFDAVFLIH